MTLYDVVTSYTTRTVCAPIICEVIVVTVCLSIRPSAESARAEFRVLPLPEVTM